MGSSLHNSTSFVASYFKLYYAIDLTVFCFKDQRTFKIKSADDDNFGYPRYEVDEDSDIEREKVFARMIPVIFY